MQGCSRFIEFRNKTIMQRMNEEREPLKAFTARLDEKRSRVPAQKYGEPGSQ